MASDLEPSGLDSARFGMRVGRLRLATGEPAADVVDRFRGSGLDVLVVRHDAADTDVAWTLTRAASGDVVLLHAGTLVHFTGPAEPSAIAAPVGYVEAGIAPDRLASLVRSVFSGYRNHYSANPLMRPSDITEGYVEWALSHGDRPERPVVAVSDVETGGVRGFVVGSVEADVASIALNGVEMAHRGRGVYQHMLDLFAERAARLGASEIAISTQAGNLTVQRAWQRRGWSLSRVEQTRHLVRRSLLRERGLVT